MAVNSDMRGHDEFSEDRDSIPLKESEGEDDIKEDEHQYPSTAKLIPILIALCCQSFCIALVRPYPTYLRHMAD